MSRRAEKGDFVALGRDASGISGPTVRRQKFQTTMICDFRKDYPILYSEGCAVVTALLAAREQILTN